MKINNFDAWIMLFLIKMFYKQHPWCAKNGSTHQGNYLSQIPFKTFLSFFFFCEHLQIFLRFPALFQKELRQINVYPALQVWNNSSPLSTSENCFLSEIHFFNGIPQQIMLDWAVYKMYTAIQLMWVFTVKFKRLS